MAVTEETPYLQDPDGTTRAGVDALLTPAAPVDESPVGRMRALDAATARMYDEMYRILTGGVVLPPGEYDAQLRDGAGVLVDLHKQTERAFDATWAW